MARKTYATDEHEAGGLVIHCGVDADPIVDVGDKRSRVRRSPLLDVVGAFGTCLFQQRTGRCLRHPSQHSDLWCERIWRALFQSNPGGRHEFASVLPDTTLVQRQRRAVACDRVKRDANLQHRRIFDDDRSALHFLLDGRDVRILARAGAQSAAFVVLDYYRFSDRPWISLQIHERPGIDFHPPGAGFRASATAGIQADRSIFASRSFCRLYAPTHHLE